MEWAMAELINNPRVMEKARQELDAVMLGKNRIVDESDIVNLPYIQAIVRETSRRVVVDGYDIPAKTRLPERFIDEDGEYCEPFGFGSGRKMGPGISLALPLLHATLAAMAQCFELKLDGILDMEEKPGLVVPRAHSVTCVPLPRIHPFPSI
ncbi:hypothetical protein AHAS_Ahas06G0093300 [Arachis hypogaea]